MCVRVCVCECEGAQAGSVVEQEDVVEKSITLHRAGHNTQVFIQYPHNLCDLENTTKQIFRHSLYIYRAAHVRTHGAHKEVHCPFYFGKLMKRPLIDYRQKRAERGTFVALGDQ